MKRLSLATFAATLVYAATLTSAAAAEERPRVVAVSGQGEVQAEPDQAIVTLGV